MNNSKIKILPLDDNWNDKSSGRVTIITQQTDKKNKMLLYVEVLRGQIIANHKISGEDRNLFLTQLDLLRGSILSADFSHHQEKNINDNWYNKREISDETIEFPNFIGKNPKIQKILQIAGKIAKTDYPVLITGETGTGKEVFARIIHEISQRNKFLPINCSAIPGSLVESEFFGYAKGSFTGANSFRPGKFEEANDGTIFLDEIGELEENIQSKLLRVLQFGEIQRIGCDKVIKVNVRIIAATNKNLAKLIEEGKFRDDLYYRLSICEIHCPPLRERTDEIPVLLDLFLKNAAENLKTRVPVLSVELKHFLFNEYYFPGNIRELENIAKLITALTPAGEAASIEYFPEVYQEKYNLHKEKKSSKTGSLKEKIDLIQRCDLEKYLIETAGNIKKVADLSGLSPSRIYQLCSKYSLNPSTYKRR